MLFLECRVGETVAVDASTRLGLRAVPRRGEATLSIAGGAPIRVEAPEPTRAGESIRQVSVVLAAIDEPRLACMLERALRACRADDGRVVPSVGDAIGELEALAATADRPDLMLVSQARRRDGGLALVRWVRDQRETQRTPIVMVARDERDPFIHTALDAGASGVMTRPRSVYETADTLERLLELWAARTPA
jgi:CheY-like chemotaxis protein